MNSELYKIKNDILNKFRELNAGENHVIPPRWLGLFYFPTLNPKEKEVFEKAIEELINEKLIVPVNDTIKLTKKGVDKIYPDYETSPKEKIKNDILDKFREIKAGENHVIPPRWLGLIYFPTLNPKEKMVFDETIEELITDGIVLSARDTIKLTPKGVKEIY
ncbi:MAG: hypothetical protein GY795_16830 [Desulfobacterales bacterium]|nr:hypothetical protein [Desulfobacterales bacterium]